MSKAAAQKNIQNRVVYLTDLFYIYDEIKRKHNFEEAMKYKDFWASLTKKDENTQTLIEHNVFNLGKIFKLKDSQMLIDNSNELYEIDSSTKDFLSEVENLVKKADKIVLVTKPSTLNLLLLDEVLNILQITRETRTIYYIPVETLKSDFLNEKCFFMSHSNKDNILISDDVMQGMENIEKYINESVDGNEVAQKILDTISKPYIDHTRTRKKYRPMSLGRNFNAMMYYLFGNMDKEYENYKNLEEYEELQYEIENREFDLDDFNI